MAKSSCIASHLIPVMLALALVPACNSRINGVDPGNDPDGGTTGDGMTVATGITVNPAQIQLTVDGAPATAQFTAKADDGTDVTATATWSVEQSLGTVAAGLVTLPATLGRGGPIHVTAQLGDKSGTGVIVVKYVAPDVAGPGAPPSPRGVFGGAPGGPAPTVVYPFDGVMLAKNINQMQPAWQGGGTLKYYRILVDSPTYTQAIYLGAQACNGAQCSYLIDDKVWAAVATNAGDATMTIAGTVGTGQPVGSSAGLGLHFSPADVKGGLYYFSTTKAGLLRLPFGATKAQTFIQGGLATNPNDNSVNRCVGCHAVSRDGKKVAAEWAGGDGYGGIVDGADPKKYLMTPQASKAGQVWNFASFNQDGTRLITVWNGKMSLRNGDTGALISDVSAAQLGGRASMVEWSPDGKSIVFVRITGEGKLGSDFSLSCGANGPCLPAGDWILGDAGDIAVLPVSGDTFGTAVTVVARTPGQEYHTYPSFSPDSQWIVFNSARAQDCASETAANNPVDLTGIKCVSYNQTATRLRLVKASGGTPIELAAATRTANKTTAWPKFAPFQQGNLVFFTYSSKFNYGWVVQQTSPGRPQIWMSGIDLSKAGTGQDPSFPPFWLPFQDPTTNNHEVLWTKDIQCTVDSDCGAEFTCTNGTCQPRLG